MEKEIEVNSASVTYFSSGVPVHALDGISLEVHRGEFVSIVGPSGCGKTTLLRLALGLIHELPPHMVRVEGSVEVEGKNPILARSARRFALVSQNPVLLPWRTVAGNVALPLEVAGAGGRENRRRLVENTLGSVGLADFGRLRPMELSGGMQQRVALARAIVLRPRIWLFDEPFGNLDEVMREQLQEDVIRLCCDLNASALLVTHDVEEAVFMSDRVVVMSPMPGKATHDIKVGFPRPRQRSVRESADFVRAVRAVRRVLRGGIAA